MKGMFLDRHEKRILKLISLFLLLLTLTVTAVGCASKGDISMTSEGEVGKLIDLFVVNKQSELNIVFVSDKNIDFNSFMVAEPLRLVVDIAGIDVSGIKNKVDVHSGAVLEITKKNFSTSKGFARFEIHLMQPSPYDVEKKNNMLLVKFLKPSLEAESYDFDIKRKQDKEVASEDVSDENNEDKSAAALLKNSRQSGGDDKNNNTGLPPATVAGQTSNPMEGGMPLISSRSKSPLDQVKTSSNKPVLTSLNITGEEDSQKVLKNLSEQQPSIEKMQRSKSKIVEEDISPSSAKQNYSESGSSKSLLATEATNLLNVMTLESAEKKNSALENFRSKWDARKRKTAVEMEQETDVTDLNKSNPIEISAMEGKEEFQGKTYSPVVENEPAQFLLSQGMKEDVPFADLISKEENLLESRVQKTKPKTPEKAPAAPAEKPLNDLAKPAPVIPEPAENEDIPGNYSIGSADVLEVLVWKNDALSKEVIVRPDGKITLPLIGDFIAAGKTPMQLRADIVQRLKEYQQVPEVSVIVKEINSYVVYLLGEVLKPGSYNLLRNTSLLQAITLAGGFTQFAAKNNIVVLRNDKGKEIRYNIKYKDIVSGEGENIKLQAGDTIIIP